MRSTTFLIVLFYILLSPIGLISQNLIQNGDFEKGIDKWSVAGKVDLSQDFAYSGSNAIEFDTEISDYGYLYQKLLVPATAFEVVFWICPKSQIFYSIFELVADWSYLNSHNTKFVARIEFKQDKIRFTALDVDTTINNVLELNYWNKVAIRADEYGLRKTLYINDQLVCNLIPSYLLPVETLILGDVCATDDYGKLFYDNISIFGSNLLNFPKYSQSPFDIIYCDSLQPKRILTFDLTNYQNLSSIKLVYGYVNFDQIGGDYPQTDPGTVSFCVKIGDQIIDEVLAVKNNYRIKREIDLLPYWANSSVLVIDFSYQGGDDAVEIVRPVIAIVPKTAVNADKFIVPPRECLLYQNYPNPFNPMTTIEYEIDKPGYVSISIFNNAGQQVKTLVNRFQTIGNYTATWDGMNEQGERCASGPYYYCLRANERADLKSMMLLK